MAAPPGVTFRAHIRSKVHESERGRVEVLSGLDLLLPERTFTAMIGPSGCGKTTTLRILMGLDAAFDGTVDPAFRTARIGVAFQEPRLLPWRTVAENVALALGGRDDGRVAPALEAVGLGGLGARYPGELSLGQARRAALARAFAVRPDLLLLDEPFVSLDEASAQRLRALLMELWRADPVTVLMVTHNVREAVQLADRIVLLTERPAQVAAVVPVDLPREVRTPEAVAAFVADLAAAYPRLVAV